uniref:Envelope protein n=1 Tax=Biju errantivirus TaxID=3078397 RepID=A0AB38Z2L1_9VIRU
MSNYRISVALAMIEIRRIDDVPILAFSRGNARIQTSSRYYIHHFNLSSIKHQVEVLKLDFEQVENNQFTYFLNLKFKHVETMINNLSPTKRSKRWDALGTVWKFIAGNPDANDLKIINSSINGLIDNNNKQIKINRNLNSQLKAIAQDTKEYVKLAHAKNSEILSMNILFNLNYLAERLAEITQSISLAKLGIVNENIFSQEEINLIANDIIQQKISIHNPLEAVSLADISIATNTKELVLLIKTPVLDERQFRKIYVYPVPVNKSKILLRNPNYLVNENNYYVVESLGQQIYSKLEKDESECIPNILQGIRAACNYTTNPSENEITHIDAGNVVISSYSNLTLTTNCGVTNRTLNGVFHIKYSDCDIIINNETISTKILDIRGEPIPLNLDGIDVAKSNVFLNMTLNDLQELHQETRKQMEYIRLTNTSIAWPTWSIGGLVTLPWLVAGIMLLIRCKNRSTTINLQNSAAPSNSTAPTENPTIELDDIPVRSYKKPSLTEVIRVDPHH